MAEDSPSPQPHLVEPTPSPSTSFTDHLLLASLDRFESFLERIQKGSSLEPSASDLVDSLLDEITTLLPTSLLAVCTVDENAQAVVLDRCRPAELADDWREEIRRLLPPDRMISLGQQERPIVCPLHNVHSHHPEVQVVVLLSLTALLDMRGVILVALQQPEVSTLELQALSSLVRQATFALDYARREHGLRRALADEFKKTLEVNDRLTSVDRARESLLATVSHELRTPLSAIVGSLELFREEWREQLPPEAQRMIDICERNSSALLALISDLLDVAALRSSPPALLKQTIPLTSLVQETFEIISPLASVNRVRLENAVPAEVHVQADPYRLRQILLHLESNAVKFCGQNNPYLRVRAVVEETRIVLEVSDNGVGIAPERLEHIFEPFVQGEDSYTSPTKGAGLGLTICKSLIEYHNGLIWVKSELGQGSCFSVSLPRV
ncbi:MAG: sensor histidine kinase [Candidatus Binatia bacterium]